MIKFEPVFFDSMGAKSTATLVETPDIKIFIDPGAAEMQPSFPAPQKLKIYWKKLALERIKNLMKKVDAVVISHYHHDHYLWKEEDIEFYLGKKIFTKNPNEFINESQRKRAVELFENLGRSLGVNIWGTKKEKKKYKNPLEDLHHALSKDFGDYNARREVLLRKGLAWFEKLSNEWNSFQEVREFGAGEASVMFPETRTYRFGETVIRFTPPLFHGVEFSRTGWVFATIVEHGGEKLIHTSDLNGPVIEDYADWIIEEKPDYLIVDGPMTYMLGYLVSNITLGRTIENMVRIIENARPRVVIYDHHLLREPGFRLRTGPVWEAAVKNSIRLTTAAEYLGIRPKVFMIYG